MKKFGISLILFIVISLFISSVSYADQYFPPTPSQKHFTAIVNGLPGVVNADWRTPISMWVKVSSKAVGSPPDSQKAYTLAHILAERGRTALYQPFCVHIYTGSNNEIGSDCVY